MGEKDYKSSFSITMTRMAAKLSSEFQHIIKSADAEGASKDRGILRVIRNG